MCSQQAYEVYIIGRLPRRKDGDRGANKTHSASSDADEKLQIPTVQRVLNVFMENIIRRRNLHGFRNNASRTEPWKPCLLMLPSDGCRARCVGSSFCPPSHGNQRGTVGRRCCVLVAQNCCLMRALDSIGINVSGSSCQCVTAGNS